ncbi:piggyBac transposable element-derived protein 4-like [Rhinichthys klamathensis goyatoka]|uniref:piggyBac transposable element-derived protein 4-like n=1 Tax=Rhinichthys klamathensis goyatoka TaxID=3034132 RepID=UPI0024B60E61|nr:piggyBac transposable element-derived protein 4-like [Rhinichthys klamathensis goyatoka]
MAKQLSAHDVIHQIFDSETSEEEMQDASCSEDVSEEGGTTESATELETTDEEQSSSDEGPAEVTVSFWSKDGTLSWSSSPPMRQGRFSSENVMKMKPGLTRYAISRIDDIQSCFNLFVTEPIENIVISMTNLEGRRVFKDKWKTVDSTDIQAYMGLLIMAGVYRSRNESTDSLWDADTGRAIFRATMSQQTSHVLSRVIRFDNRETRHQRHQNDKLAPIRELWDKWVERLPLIYNPGPAVTVDERLVAFRGRCRFKQYIPNKPAKYGIKLWTACDSKTSYAWNMQVYTGKSSSGVPEKNQGQRVVLEMTEGLQGHTVVCDNFYTSYNLGKELLRKKNTMVGTIRRNKTELPPALVTNMNRDLFSTKFAFTDTHALVSYCPKKRKNVLLMSTLHKDACVSTREDRKPEAILYYNENKGGVDNLDKVTGTYSCKRKTLRWPMVLFFNILDVSAYNAFVAWMEVNPGWKEGKTFRRRLFLEELGKSMVTPLIQRRQNIPRALPSATLVRDIQTPEPGPSVGTGRGEKRKRCTLCAPKDVKTGTVCFKCRAHICKAHTLYCCQSCA